MSNVTWTDEDPERYTVASNEFMEDPRLTFKAKGLMVYLKGRPPGWQPQVHHLATVSADGKASVETGLQELIELGYMRRSLVRQGNRIAGTDYGFSWRPRWADDPARYGPRSPKSRSGPVSQQPGPVEPGNQVPQDEVPRNEGPGNQPLISTDLPTTDLVTTEPPNGGSLVADGAEAPEGQPTTRGKRRSRKTGPDPLTATEQRWVDARSLAATLVERWNQRFDGHLRVTAQGVRDADLLLRRGPVDEEAQEVPLDKALRLVAYLFDHFDQPHPTTGFCWAKVIQSPGNLREHWTRLRTDANEHREAAKVGRPAPAGRQPAGGSDEANRAAREAAKAAFAADPRPPRNPMIFGEADRPAIQLALPSAR